MVAGGALESPRDVVMSRATNYLVLPASLVFLARSRTGHQAVMSGPLYR